MAPKSNANTKETQIEDWALNHFDNSKEPSFSFDVDSYELQYFLDNTSFEDTNWNHCDFSVSGVKSYDEEYNSYWIGILIVNAEGKDVSDFLELAQIFNI
ncbi:hypothetical protein [Candidatus Sulfurimonas baltica]|uniref:Uncharacterized protein n=1 Tax=Candidatus Sulfurimonas baltica TaxID=2740404 RepID=A0A7S7RNF3_9BACT|nr:hypothetical protein [Candidatus Sulfurimonas baltica]QOY53247.1 hypothetical protein HUE88_06085 [Candidatus Sulfurimonas baltica]